MSCGTIVGDVGGTNTRLGFIATPGAEPTRIVRYENSDFESFDSALQSYLDVLDTRTCTQLCLAIAAPIDSEIVTLTNCDWQIDTARLRVLTGARSVHLLNDLEALALSLNHLPRGAISHVAGPITPRDPKGRKLVIGAGTGFNAASLMQYPSQTVLPAECGHMTLPVETAEDLRLRDFLARDRGRASVERALSGIGLVEVYQWAASESGITPEPLSGQQISDCAVQARDPLCAKAAQTVLHMLARVAGDLALAYLPHGGIYLAGSVCRALVPLMTQSGFAETFAAKGRQSGFMRSFPIQVLTDDSAALIGCAIRAQDHARLIPEPAR